jgi:hypothetical protein
MTSVSFPNSWIALPVVTWLLAMSCEGFVPSLPTSRLTTRTVGRSNCTFTAIRSIMFRIHVRRRRDDSLDGDDDNDYDDDFSFDQGERRQQRREQRGRRSGDWDYEDEDDTFDDLGYNRRKREGYLNIPSSFGQRDGWRLPEAVSKSLLAGIFVLGVGLGVTVDSAINTNPKDLASRDAVDQAAPNSKLCAEMGASAMAFDQRVFVSFNPFNVYVAQADVKPACVLRPANVVPILKDRKLINDREVFACKSNMNTWAFVGDLDDAPQLSCVYKSEDAQNEFLSNPKFGIGEDYLDDDREAGDSKKRIKDTMTNAQKEQMRKQATKISSQN